MTNFIRISPNTFEQLHLWHGDTKSATFYLLSNGGGDTTMIQKAISEIQGVKDEYFTKLKSDDLEELNSMIESLQKLIN